MRYECRDSDNLRLREEKEVAPVKRCVIIFKEMSSNNIDAIRLVQESDNLSICCTTRVSFNHFRIHFSLLYRLSTNAPHLSIPFRYRCRRWNSFLTDIWRWAADLIMVFLASQYPPYPTWKKGVVNQNTGSKPTAPQLTLWSSFTGY